jgi:hypothetical protein
MTRISTVSFLTALTLVLSARNFSFGLSESELRGPIPAKSTPIAQPAAQPSTLPVTAKSTADSPPALRSGTSAQPAVSEPMGGFSAPGADSIMTPDMLLVLPSNSKQEAPQPLSELTGKSLRLVIDRSDIVLDKLHGIKITVSNDTNRPLVIDGEKAKANIGATEYICVPVSTVQQMIIPPHKQYQAFEDLINQALPAAVTIGAAPTIRDIKISRKPILERYGRDELRRKVEFSRFGRRVLWTNMTIQGILYFETDADLTHAQITIPATTLFDNTDTALLTASPK